MNNREITEIGLETTAVESAAQALYEYLFRNLQPRLDGRHTWESSEERTREGFRREVRVVIDRLLSSRAGGWLPIASAPKDGTHVQLYGDPELGTKFTVNSGWYSPRIEEWILCGGDGVWLKPTHWQPLPPPPITEGQGIMSEPMPPPSPAALPDGSGFFIAEIDPTADPGPPIQWNPWNKVVQDHRDGTIHHDLTNQERAKRGLPVPWTPAMGDTEAHERPIP